MGRSDDFCVACSEERVAAVQTAMEPCGNIDGALTLRGVAQGESAPVQRRRRNVRGEVCGGEASLALQKAAASCRTSMKTPGRVKWRRFCERCGYTSIRARGTKGGCTASAAPSPSRPVRTQCGTGLTEVTFHIAAKIRSSKQTPWVHSAHTAPNSLRANAVRATCGCLRRARRVNQARAAGE